MLASPHIPDLSDTESSDSDSDSSSSMHEEVPVVPIVVKKVAGPENKIKLSNKVLSKWPVEDLSALVDRIKKTLPENDITKFTKRVEKIEWANIAFNGHSADDCSRVWSTIQRGIRKDRILNEILCDAEEAISKIPRTTNKKQKIRHPEQPKRSLSAYMIFCMDKREEVNRENAGIRNAAAAKLLGEMYRKLSEDDRNIYVKREKHLKKIYEKELEEFYNKYPKEKPKSHANNNKPQTPFQMYYERQIKTDPTCSDSESTLKKQYKEKWKNMDDNQKIEFIELAVENEKKIKTELGHDQKLKWKSVLNKEERLLIDNKAGRPQKPPHSAYSLFTQAELKKDDIKKIANSERIKTVAVQWKNCEKEVKDRYISENCELQEKYKSDFNNYLKSLPEEQRQEELRRISKKRKIVEKVGGQAKKRKLEARERNNLEKPKQPPSAPELFAQIHLDKDLNLEEAWINLSDKEKDKYKRKANQMHKEYLADFDAYAKTILEKRNIEKMRASSSLQEQSENSSTSSNSPLASSTEKPAVNDIKSVSESDDSSSSDDSSNSSSSEGSGSDGSGNNLDDTFGD